MSPQFGGVAPRGEVGGAYLRGSHVMDSQAGDLTTHKKVTFCILNTHQMQLLFLYKTSRTSIQGTITTTLHFVRTSFFRSRYKSVAERGIGVRNSAGGAGGDSPRPSSSEEALASPPNRLLLIWSSSLVPNNSFSMSIFFPNQLRVHTCACAVLMTFSVTSIFLSNLANTSQLVVVKT